MGDDDDEWRTRVNRNGNREDLCVSKRSAPVLTTNRARKVNHHSSRFVDENAPVNDD
jgi:hypothetical protein